MKCFEQAGLEVEDRRDRMLAFHPALVKWKVKVDLVCVHDPAKEDVPVLSHHGVPALAVVSVRPVKLRAQGLGDAEILIDLRRWEDMEPEKRDAVIDHELQHLEVVLDKQNNVKVDAAGRPRLRIRKHDYSFGWFEVIARRHGPASVEVQQARGVLKQGVFTFEAGPYDKDADEPLTEEP